MNSKLKLQVIEARYKNAFVYWDNTGALAAKLCSVFPTLELKTAGPGGTSLADDQLGITLDFHFEHARVQALESADGTTEIRRFAKEFFPLVFEFSGVRSLTRIGNLNSFLLDRKTEDSALQTLRRIAKAFGIESGLIEANEDERLSRKKLTRFTSRFDDEKTAISIAGMVEEQKVTVNGPYSTELRKHLPPNYFAVKLDFDSFTTVPMTTEDFLADAFLQSNEKMIRTRLLPHLEKL